MDKKKKIKGDRSEAWRLHTTGQATTSRGERVLRRSARPSAEANDVTWACRCGVTRFGGPGVQVLWGVDGTDITPHNKHVAVFNFERQLCQNVNVCVLI